MKSLEEAAKSNSSLPVRFALLAWPLEEAEVEALCERLRAPNDVRELALLACRNRERLRGARGARDASAQALLELLKAGDAFRRPGRFAELLDVAHLIENLETDRVERALRAASAVDAGEIAKRGRGGKIAQLIDEARVKAIAQAVGNDS